MHPFGMHFAFSIFTKILGTKTFVIQPIYPLFAQHSIHSAIPGLTAMAKHDDHGMTWYDHGDSYSPWYDHGKIIAWSSWDVA